MPSPITQNIGPAAAQALQNQNGANPGRDSGQVITPAQLAAASQVAAERATQGSPRSDKDRAVQTPKRTEGSFAKQANKKRAGPNAPPAEAEEHLDKDSTFKIVA